MAKRGAPGLGETGEVGHRFHQQPPVWPPFGGGGGGLMHPLRPLISSFRFHKCFLEGPSNWFFLMF